MKKGHIYCLESKQKAGDERMLLADAPQTTAREPMGIESGTTRALSKRIAIRPLCMLNMRATPKIVVICVLCLCGRQLCCLYECEIS